MKNQIVLFFLPVVVLSNIVSIIEPLPKITVSNITTVIELGLLDLIKMIVNGNLVLEPMIEHRDFHAHLNANSVASAAL
jgi:hypothetical protein